MNLMMIVSNNNKSNLFWDILNNCDFFSEELNHKPIIVNEKHFRELPTKNKKRRHIVVSPNLKSEDSNVLIFENNSKLLSRLELMTEEVYIICDREMYHYYLPYVHTIYLIDFKGDDNKLVVDNQKFSGEALIENNIYKMIKYRREI